MDDDRPGAPSTLPPPPPPPLAPDGLPAAGRWTTGAARSPGSAGAVVAAHATGSCEHCGASPATHVTFRQVTGLVLAWRVRKVPVVACGPCAVAVGRQVQQRTLVTGWWGVFATVVNLWALVRNGVELRRAARLPRPVATMRPPLAAGRPVMLRPAMLVPLGIVGVFVAALAAADDPVTWRAGSCVRVPAGETVDHVEVVDCGSPHEGKIVAVADDESSCPFTADGWVEVPGSSKAYCVDSRQ
jgi:hypothetical protein